MLEPGVFLCSVPVLDFGRNGDDGAGCHWDGFFAPFLIPAATGNANEHLHLFVMDVPVVATAGFEGDVQNTAADVGQINSAR